MGVRSLVAVAKPSVKLMVSEVVVLEPFRPREMHCWYEATEATELVKPRRT